MERTCTKIHTYTALVLFSALWFAILVSFAWAQEEISDVDIIIEADTAVPLFYKGRALPSNLSVIRAIAVPHTAKGSPSSLTYLWRLGQKVLFSGPVVGGQVVEIELPLFGKPILALEVYENGLEIARKTIRIGVTDPELYFYEDNPLRSSSRKALRGSFVLLGTETTVRGEPYYTDTTVFSGYWEQRWQVNGETVSPGNDPRTITLRAPETGGSARVSLRLVDRDKIAQYVEESFVVNFLGNE